MPVIVIDKNRINFTTVGHGEEIILAVHSSASNGRQWRAFGEQMDKKFRLIAPDVYGHGGSDAWPGKGSMSLSSESAILSEMIARLGNRRVHLVGHSYGGAVVLKAARQIKVASLTMIEPSAFWMLKTEDNADRQCFDEISRVATKLDQALYDGDYYAGMESFLDYWNGAGFWAKLSAEHQAKFVRFIGAIGLQFRSLFTETLDFVERRKIDVPTLILHGEHAKQPSMRIVDRLFREIARSQVRMIPEAGHMSPCTHPAMVNSLILKHIESLSPHGMRSHDAQDDYSISHCADRMVA